MTNMASRSFTIALITIIGLVNGLPFMIVTSGRPKCVNVQAAENSSLRVIYEAPDLKLDKNDEKYGPTYITVTHKPARKIGDMMEDTHDARKKRVHPKKLPTPTNKELDALSGTLSVKVAEDGEVSVCIRASLAGMNNPLRFGLRVEEADEDEEDEKSGDSGMGVDSHLSFMEAEMTRIERSMHHILSEANFAKERDSIFHKQSNDMHAATLFWPIMHVGVLLVTGFTQASHIVRFFKSRRII